MIRLTDASKNGSKVYEEVFIKNKLGLIDLQSIVPSLKLTPEVIFMKCTTIMPRYYTIASSSLMFPDDLHIAISMSTIEVNKDNKTFEREGLVSGYLTDIWKRWQAGEKVSFKSKCFVKDSNFDMPASSETPMLMVGPGTGVVPFIGFMQERAKARENNAEITLGEAHLYFGCREKDTDFIYRDEMA